MFRPSIASNKVTSSAPPTTAPHTPFKPTDPVTTQPPRTTAQPTDTTATPQPPGNDGDDDDDDNARVDDDDVAVNKPNRGSRLSSTATTIVIGLAAGSVLIAVVILTLFKMRKRPQGHHSFDNDMLDLDDLSHLSNDDKSSLYADISPGTNSASDADDMEGMPPFVADGAFEESAFVAAGGVPFMPNPHHDVFAVQHDQQANPEMMVTSGSWQQFSQSYAMQASKPDHPNAPTRNPFTSATPLEHHHQYNHHAVLQHRSIESGVSGAAFPPLLVSVCSGDAVTVQALLQQGADPNVRTPDGIPALHIAVSLQATGTAQALLTNGANPNLLSSEGHSPFTLAVAGGDTGMVSVLLQYQVDVNAPDAHGMAPLLIAASHGNEELVQLLLTHPSIDPTIKDTRGMTALHWAVC
ncbi:hypothetical protein PTSG_03073 [Salpingoeca rosetta]|uniref:Uncharacterized protein n=1 Tax=Salpingoeca rosetta (strain ATCC 50818 / BSB-021) TaxID=946362 RepID=F2U462_SALR5|nr:uncharacterized protein PTSG_03073 [Salpingoeca rosetta]EGD82428.1 hypothetical protein PTSG_03073 [Salpingoeca rosetta]|eukprot:XP_004995664.1 hypothetical protein PTSG_03073 [Salpingoeca rosetta]